jgi:CheY-like chemotaxis protein
MIAAGDTGLLPRFSGTDIVVMSEQRTLGIDELKTLLLVDDNIRFLNMIIRYLQRENLYHIETEMDATKVIAKAKQLKPDLVLLDVLMPERSGEQIINDFRDDPELADIPVLFLTGLLDASECNNSILQVGTCHFLAKNTPRDIMLELIRDQVFPPRP